MNKYSIICENLNLTKLYFDIFPILGNVLGCQEGLGHIIGNLNIRTFMVAHSTKKTEGKF